MLFPLNKLCINSPKLVENIPTNFCHRAEAIISMYVNVQIQIEKLIKNDTCLFIPSYKSQLLTYKKIIESYKKVLENKLSVLLPNIRDGKIPLCKLEDVIKDIEISPFNPQKLFEWIGKKQLEIQNLEVITSHLKHLELIDTAEKFQKLTSSAIFCFSLSFVQLDKSRLDLMFKHLYSQEKIDPYNSSPNWYENRTLLDKIKAYSANFKNVCMENQNMDNTKFVILLLDEILTKNQIELNSSDGEFTWLYKDGGASHFVPPSVPGMPTTTSKSYNSISLEWSEPEYGAESLANYTVAYQSEGKNKKVWKQKHTEGVMTNLHLSDLESDTIYRFTIKANFTNGINMGNKNIIRIKTVPLPLAHRTKKNSKFIKKGPPNIYQLKMTENHKDLTGMVSWQSFGSQPLTERKKKVLIVVGATGAGKTTLINGMVNYIFKVEWNDDFHFKLVVDEGKETQAKSQMVWITAYTFYKVNDSPLDYTLTIIDTPGFGDISGLKRDKEITEQIRKMFSSQGPYSIDQLDGIGFVV